MKTKKEPFGYLTAMASRVMVRSLTLSLKPYDLTPEQWTVLKRLAEEDDITQKELALRSDKDQPTITRILDILERKQFISRKPNGEDRRSYRILITGKGREHQELVRPLVEEQFESKLLNRIPPEHLEIFKSVLFQMIDNLENTPD
ncbi:MarR family transcriptional regulator [Paenibacillus aurantius]|uniref:MarR family transcriptional regulator n=1 Tax=Paenibacillus aurantius TaxID=2918900 RepID=A0AA96RDI5_9BACL|nr:MarR family transcriptional regulator [Paenibacillus aurantius]WNQ09867.1 MarR family transcriptional regulator [Paenibacillus aurantius]